MSKINEININITKAVVTKISIELDIDKQVPVFTIQGTLVSDTGRKVSDFVYGSDWYNDSKIEIPASANFPSSELFKIFTPIICEKINGVFKAVEAPKKNKV